jgi:hypothetical protein
MRVATYLARPSHAAASCIHTPLESASASRPCASPRNVDERRSSWLMA